MKKTLFILILHLICLCSFCQSRYISQTVKKIVYTRDGGNCNCCGSSSNLEYDHVIPFSCGGRSEVSNIQLLCLRCNRSKSNSCYCKVHNKKVGINCCDGRSKATQGSFTTNASSRTTAAESQQCFGTTKKGARCGNVTRNINGSCHLHQ